MSESAMILSVTVAYVGLGFALLKFSISSAESQKKLVPVRVRARRF